MSVARIPARFAQAPPAPGVYLLLGDEDEVLYVGKAVDRAFPHIGKGKHSWRAVRSNAGCTALLRLLWVAHSDQRVRSRLPARLRGSSPPVDHEGRFEPESVVLLHDFLSGRSSRLLRRLAALVTADDLPEFMRRPLNRDVASAAEFYELGPHAVRAFRLRHGLRAGPVTKETFTRLTADDVRTAIGDFRLPGCRDR